MYRLIMIGFMLLLPVQMIVFGLLFSKRPPKKINYGFGYRTRMACLNEQTWRFAHVTLGKVWVRLGAAMLAISLVLGFMAKSEDQLFTAMITAEIMQMIAMFISIVPVEAALRKRFDSRGQLITDKDGKYHEE